MGAAGDDAAAASSRVGVRMRRMGLHIGLIRLHQLWRIFDHQQVLGIASLRPPW